MAMDGDRLTHRAFERHHAAMRDRKKTKLLAEAVPKPLKILAICEYF